MVRKIFWYMTLVSLVCLVLSLGISLWVFSAYYGDQMQDELDAETGYIAAGLRLAEDETAYLSQAGVVEGDKRITLVDTDGRVLYDSHAEEEELENHLDRSEIAQAFAEGIGSADRFSATQGTRVYYHARRLEDGKILRLASPSYSIRQLAGRMAVPAGILFLVLFLLTLFLSAKLTRHILKPIEALDLDTSPDADVYEELQPFVQKIRVQKEEIGHQKRRVGRQKERLQALTQHMQEGLLILSGGTEILSINPSAAKIFDTDTSVIGEHLVHLTRDVSLLRAGKAAAAGESQRLEMEHEGKVYRVFCSPVYKGEKKGALLLFLDVTESVQAEQIRREFSANVSHELKTPLTNILGYSQMLGHGMAKPEDAQRFAQKIEKETERVVRLVDDIIKQSQLDEEGTFERQPVNLLTLCQQVAERLEEEAGKSGISITYSGAATYVLGNPSMLEELVFNLVENAVKYNRPDGTVNLCAEEAEDGRACLSVEDTGIGIPREEIPRIYERFYRVDKSHSRQIGGTGLGLSIVKHIARLHQAQIETDSTLGKGTRISVYFPGLR